MHGDIVATFTWTGSGLPPKQVLVKQSCVTSGTSPIVQQSNGLGDVSGKNGDDATTYYYSVKDNSGSSFTVTCSPYIEVGSKTGFVPYKSASLWYTAAAQTLDLSLTGGIVENNVRKYLVGQKMTASVVSTLTASSHNWSITGGSPFKSFTASVVNPNVGSLQPVDTYTSTTLSSCFAAPGTIDVSCAVYLAVPPGSKPSLGFNVAVRGQVTVQKPACNVLAERDDGEVQLGTNTIVYSGMTRYYGGGVTGIELRAEVVTPAQYHIGVDKGVWNYVQIVNLGRRRQLVDGTWQSARMPKIVGQVVEYVAEGLDAKYPYTPEERESPEYNRYDWDAVPQPQGAISDPLYGILEDLLGMDFEPALAGRYEVNEAFKVYVMYRPPGAGSQYVPLHRFDWYWKGIAVKNLDGSWSLSGPLDEITESVSETQHPTWTIRILATQLQWVND